MPSTIGTAYIQIEPTTSGIGSKISSQLGSEASNAGSSAGSKFASAFGTTAKVAGLALTATTTAVAGFAKASVDAGMSFDSAMSQVGATMGDNAQKMISYNGETVESIVALRDFAQQMGSTTAFSSMQASEGLNVLAMAGFDAEQQMQALPQVLSLASAGGLDLAQSADFLTGVMAGFGQEVSEVNTKHIADLLATMSASAKGSVADFGTGLSTVAGMASTTGQKMDDMAVALEILGNNNVAAAEGGNSLNRVLKNLYQATSTGQKGLDALGVSAYTAEGEARPLQDVLLDLNGALNGMSTQAKNDALSQIFDSATLKTVPFLINGVTDSWENLAKGISEADNASKNMADTQLDNLAGDITLFQSALEGAKIAVSDQLTPSLREFVTFGSEGLSRLTEAFKSGGLSGAMSEFGTLVSEAVNMIVADAPQMINAGLSLLSALGQGLVDNMPILIDSALQVVNMLVDYVIANAPALLETGMQLLVQLGEGIAQALPTLIPAMVEVIINMTMYLLQNVDLLVECAGRLILGLATGIINAIPVLVASVPQLITALVNALISFYGKLNEIGKQLMVKLGEGIKVYKESVANMGREVLNRLKEAILNKVSEFISIGSDIVKGIRQGIENAWSSVVSWFSAKVGELAQGVKDALKIGSPSRVFANDVGRWIPAGIAMGIENNMGVIDDAMNDVNDTLTTNAVVARASFEATANGSSMYNNVASNNSVYGLLADYLPLLASGNNVNVTLEGDAKALFKSVKTQNDIYTRTTGVTAFA